MSRRPTAALQELSEAATPLWSFALPAAVVVNSADWSPDGRLVVLHCYPDFLVVLDGRSGAQVRRLGGLQYLRGCIGWSADGRELFAQVLDEIRVWDTASWSEVRRMPLKPSGPVDVDRAATRLVVACDCARGLTGHGQVVVLSLADGSIETRLQTNADLSGAALSPAGQTATWANGRSIQLWDLHAPAAPVRTLQIEQGMPNRVIWSPSGSTMVVATNGGALEIFDAGSGQRRFLRDQHRELAGGSSRVYAMAFSTDGRWFASKDHEGTVLFWKTARWSPFAVLRTNSFDWRRRGPPVLAIQPGEDVVLTQNEDCTGVTVWRLAKARRAASTATARKAPVAAGTQGPTLITLAELKRLGAFVRWQEVDERLRSSSPGEEALRSYPLFPGRSEPDRDIDVLVDSRWRRVRFRHRDGPRIAYEDEGRIGELAFDRYTVAPAGHYSGFETPEFPIGEAGLAAGAVLDPGYWVVNSRLLDVQWPYLELQVKQVPQHAPNSGSHSLGTHLFHVADPRLVIDSVARQPPRFNAPIAVSHRWLEPDHPDRHGLQYRELIDRAQRLHLHPMQPFLIDYCSLPQHPRTEEEEAIFEQQMAPFHTAFTGSAIVIEEGSADYATRAWCMLELMLIAIEGGLADSPGELRQAPQLPRHLGKTWADAVNYLELANANMHNLYGAFRASRRDPVGAYLADDRHQAFRSAMKASQNRLLEMFDKELQVTDPADRPRIKRLLRELVFARGVRA
jgi:hypothetical protein